MCGGSYVLNCKYFYEHRKQKLTIGIGYYFFLLLPAIPEPWVYFTNTANYVFCYLFLYVIYECTINWRIEVESSW